jgi:catechol 2,3-dioxygenase-like lactoylglutathione lyase family enzyme
MTAMDITIHGTFLPHDDPDASLAFYRDTLGFEVRNDVAYGGCAGSRSAPPTSPGRRFPGFPFVIKLDKTHRDCNLSHSNGYTPKGGRKYENNDM